ncbi:MAG: hypothetical protein ACI4I1_07005, partial [Oscillospiraceae bacterium]
YRISAQIFSCILLVFSIIKDMEIKMGKENKRLIIGVCIVLFVLLIIFAIYAGTRIGADIGEFIYNIRNG